MTPPSADPKASLRAQVLARLQSLSAAERAAASAQLCARFAHEAMADGGRLAGAGCILCFAPLADEPDIWPLVNELLAGDRIVALPRFDPATGEYGVARIRHPQTDLNPGAFGIPEPASGCPAVALNRLDLVLVPGVAFDVRGCRLGRGKGFYDRLLPQVRGTTCGVAFDEQIVEAVPVEPHDICLDCILTPTRLIET